MDNTDNKQILTDFTNDGECSGCGECCSNYLPLTRWEIHRLKLWAQRHKYVPELTGDVLDVTCPFLDKHTKRCVCYKERPEICKQFTCRKAIAKDPDLVRIQAQCDIHNLRLEIFGDKNTLPYGHFVLLMEYIRNNPSGSMEIQVKED